MNSIVNAMSYAADVILPVAGDRTNPLPFILIGVAVLLVVGIVVVRTIMNKKDDDEK